MCIILKNKNKKKSELTVKTVSGLKVSLRTG